MVVHNEVLRDGRVLKEAASAAAAGWRVVVVGLSLTGRAPARMAHPAGFTIVSVRPLFVRPTESPNRAGLLLRLLLALPGLLWATRRANARLYHANDFTGLLQVALAGVWRRPVVYDSHELFFDRPLPDLPAPVVWLVNRMRRLERWLARRAAAVITVNDSIADRLAQTLGVPRPAVVRNAVDLRGLPPAAAAYPRDGRRLLAHSGRLIHARHLSEMVAALAHLPPDIALVLMGEGPLAAPLQAQAEALGVADRLFIVPPVPPAAVAPTLAQADVALVLTSTDGLNNLYSLPNKFFEAVAAGLPIITGPNVEIAGLLRRYDMGQVCNPDDPASIAAAALELLRPENQARYRANAQRARAELNWEAEERALLDVYVRLLNGTPA